MLNTLYLIKNRINSKVYVGQTWNSLASRKNSVEWSGYTGCTKLMRAIKKHGPENFFYEVITLCSTQESADATERDLIIKHNSVSKGYNISEGGSNSRLTEATKQKLSLAHTGTKASDATKAKMSAAHIGKPNTWQKGVPLSLEHKKKLSEATKGKPKTAEHAANISIGSRGKPKSASHRANISKAGMGKVANNKGKPMSEEQKAKLSASVKAWWIAKRKAA